MIKEIYLWTNGTVMVFGESGAQIPELQGLLTEELKLKIQAHGLSFGARITFARWKAGFFQITWTEFMTAEAKDGGLLLHFYSLEQAEDEKTFFEQGSPQLGKKE